MGNFDSLMEPVSDEAPSGENLQHTPAFAKLEKDSQGTPERQMGEVVVPGEPPDWRAVRAQALDLLQTTRDLRVAVQLARASLMLDGYTGFADALMLIDAFVVNFWPTLHPELDHEEDDDPTARITAIQGLVLRDTLSLIRSAPLFVSRAFGPIALKDVEAGRPSGDGTTSVESLFASIQDDALIAAAGAAERCFAGIKALDEHWSGALPGAGPDFAPLIKLLLQARDTLRARAQARAASAGSGAAGTASGDDGASSGGEGSPAGGRRSGGAPGEIRSRDDVVRTLDRICAYYAESEPSSPVPLLIERCKRLVTMSFFDIVEDMFPDGVSTVETITGKRQKSEEENE